MSRRTGATTSRAETGAGYIAVGHPGGFEPV